MTARILRLPARVSIEEKVRKMERGIRWRMRLYRAKRRIVEARAWLRHHRSAIGLVTAIAVIVWWL